MRSGKVWLIGAGNMATDYAKILIAQNIDFTAIGRSKENAIKMEDEVGVKIEYGGIEEFTKINKTIPESAIVSVGVEELYNTALCLLELGIKNILLEKPGAVDIKSLKKLKSIAKAKSVNLFIAYNRRCYASVLKLKELIYNDGGLRSFNFEFTEWAHIIVKLPSSDSIKNNWLIANSTHVIDLAFFIGGKPIEMSSYHSGSLNWHPSGAIFTGAGLCQNNILFSYSANWTSAGRWALEFMTEKNRYILKPMERLTKIKIGSVNEEEVLNIDYSLDDKYKPGLYLQVKNFLEKDFDYLCSVEEQITSFDFFARIGNY